MKRSSKSGLHFRALEYYRKIMQEVIDKSMDSSFDASMTHMRKEQVKLTFETIWRENLKAEGIDIDEKQVIQRKYKNVSIGDHSLKYSTAGRGVVYSSTPSSLQISSHIANLRRTLDTLYLQRNQMEQQFTQQMEKLQAQYAYTYKARPEKRVVEIFSERAKQLQFDRIRYMDNNTREIQKYSQELERLSQQQSLQQSRMPPPAQSTHPADVHQVSTVSSSPAASSVISDGKSVSPASTMTSLSSSTTNSVTPSTQHSSPAGSSPVDSIHGGSSHKRHSSVAAGVSSAPNSVQLIDHSSSQAVSPATSMTSRVSSDESVSGKRRSAPLDEATKPSAIAADASMWEYEYTYDYDDLSEDSEASEKEYHPKEEKVKEEHPSIAISSTSSSTASSVSSMTSLSVPSSCSSVNKVMLDDSLSTTSAVVDGIESVGVKSESMASLGDESTLKQGDKATDDEKDRFLPVCKLTQKDYDVVRLSVNESEISEGEFQRLACPYLSKQDDVLPRAEEWERKRRKQRKRTGRKVKKTGKSSTKKNLKGVIHALASVTISKDHVSLRSVTAKLGDQLFLFKRADVHFIRGSGPPCDSEGKTSK
ncbi:hypothetical protein ADUPG1_009146 [Aduncisulcus paluster]|uniref:Uncharacterized protein n=1 Tax=Aduncisulcus paluster TaxID=2918883 RepID=A0ABQ5KUH7_9EUKA|nr:hypothetical protein ADUPG1_009146 [Aduncisulcus paluster]|eukprot:gnl/Carplike_NY0171/3087_a4144_510.p1 GENE.gnl/Carplike_NY0171/3087_a4144_510~~gnl/Carplike_NY0171/3087_a4144_510.p1  ORF type:complete len:592 (+),score=130.78 gnl/Carplike_NY0171/3087_a4144_510:22-1797(+)